MTIKVGVIDSRSNRLEASHGWWRRRPPLEQP
jgi:hypothetical protein